MPSCFFRNIRILTFGSSTREYWVLVLSKTFYVWIWLHVLELHVYRLGRDAPTILQLSVCIGSLSCKQDLQDRWCARWVRVPAYILLRTARALWLGARVAEMRGVAMGACKKQMKVCRRLYPAWREPHQRCVNRPALNSSLYRPIEFATKTDARVQQPPQHRTSYDTRHMYLGRQNPCQCLTIANIQHAPTGDSYVHKESPGFPGWVKFRQLLEMRTLDVTIRHDTSLYILFRKKLFR